MEGSVRFLGVAEVQALGLLVAQRGVHGRARVGLLAALEGRDLLAAGPPAQERVQHALVALDVQGSQSHCNDYYLFIIIVM